MSNTVAGAIEDTFVTDKGGNATVVRESTGDYTIINITADHVVVTSAIAENKIWKLAEAIRQ